MTSASQKQTLLQQQIGRERGRRWAERWWSFRAAVTVTGPGIAFLWGYATGSSLSFAPMPVRLAAAMLTVGIAGYVLWGISRKRWSR